MSTVPTSAQNEKSNTVFVLLIIETKLGMSNIVVLLI